MPFLGRGPWRGDCGAFTRTLAGTLTVQHANSGALIPPWLDFQDRALHRPLSRARGISAERRPDGDSCVADAGMSMGTMVGSTVQAPPPGLCEFTMINAVHLNGSAAG